MPIFSSYDGTKLWYEPLGTGDGAPLIVLPGGPGTDLRYLGTVGGLDQDRPLVLLDPRATGRSAVPEDRAAVAFAQQARDVEALREHLGLARIDLLAHSAGTLIAQQYAAAHPDRVRRMVLVTPVGRAAREPDPAELAALRAARSGEPWYQRAVNAELRLESEQLPPEQESFLRAVLLPFSWHSWSRDRLAEYVPGHSSTFPWLRDAFYAGSTTDPADLARLAVTDLPVLVVAGASDGLLGTAPARAVAALHPGARLAVLDRSGHRPWVEQPQEFRELVNSFLAEQ
ncbi:alpha/beta hydrolase [Streptomyces tateyamensis]|uniref:Alpha/beta hydrolase n=1 Tax=Streptomyces tateyamensis TaxID=565073 RepID=A0A2V4N3H7_9ACTN|nr:alpha/beta hydrolase [Streptomyces tateyamensis]PYC78585.1 alpha/beta hydrolase [Streptomyces tateyamensis]